MQKQIQDRIKAILEQQPKLKEHFQSIKSQLQSLNPQELLKLLPSPELIAPFKFESLQMLGYLPGSFFPERSETGNIAVEIENTVMELATIILKQDDSSKASQQLIDKNKLDKK